MITAAACLLPLCVFVLSCLFLQEKEKSEAEKDEIQKRLQSEISELKSNLTTIQTVSIFLLLFWIIKDGLLQCLKMS